MWQKIGPELHSMKHNKLNYAYCRGPTEDNQCSSIAKKAKIQGESKKYNTN